jgi:hypothetical protein
MHSIRRFLIVAATIHLCSGPAFGKPTSVPLNLEQMARQNFTTPPLSEAEKRVVQHASDGSLADCSDLGGGDDPAKPEKWPASRNVRAGLVRWLLVDREAGKQVDPRGVHIRGVRIKDDLDLSFANIVIPLRCFGCRLDQDLNLRFTKLPGLSLQDSWTGAIDADGLNVEGGLFLSNGFHVERGARLLAATIGGHLVGDGGTFKNSNGYALSAEAIKVTGDVYLRNGFSAENGVQLRGAEIKGQLSVDDAWLDELVLDSAHVAGPFFWLKIHKDANRDFPDKKWRSALDLRNARVGALNDEEASWPEKETLHLDGFVYDRIAAGPTDATARLRWLDLQPKEDGYLPQPYEQLIAVLRQMGRQDQIAKVAIAEQKDLYNRGDLDQWGKFWNRVLDLVVGYGYEPWRAFLWMATLVIAGTLVFLRARLRSVPVMVPSEKDAYESDEETEKTTLPQYYPKFNALVYSLDVIFPFDLGQKSHWRLSQKQAGPFVYWGYEFYSLIQLFLGWVLLLIAASVPAGLIK